MIVVPNETLLDNHQIELADKLNGMGHLRACAVKWVQHYSSLTTISDRGTYSDLARTVSTFDARTLKPFPEFDGSRFRNILDSEMGFPV